MAATAEAEEVKVGDKIPSLVLKEGQADYGKPEDVNIADLIAGKKVAIFAVPGAFTPGEFCFCCMMDYYFLLFPQTIIDI